MEGTYAPLFLSREIAFRLYVSDRIDTSHEENRTQRRKARKETHKDVFLVRVVILKK
jgi:hypothetical protein